MPFRENWFALVGFKLTTPVLHSMGLEAVSVGANDGSTPPNVTDWTKPMPFVWADPATGTDILAIWKALRLAGALDLFRYVLRPRTT